MGFVPVFMTMNEPLGIAFSSSGLISGLLTIWRD